MKRFIVSLMVIVITTVCFSGCRKEPKATLYYASSGGTGTTLKGKSYESYFNSNSRVEAFAPKTISIEYFGMNLSAQYEEAVSNCRGTFRQYHDQKNRARFRLDSKGHVVFFYCTDHSSLDNNNRDDCLKYAREYLSKLCDAGNFELCEETNLSSGFDFGFEYVCENVLIGFVSVATNQDGELLLVTDRMQNEIEFFKKHKEKLTPKLSHYCEIADSEIEKNLEGDWYIEKKIRYSLEVLKNGNVNFVATYTLAKDGNAFIDPTMAYVVIPVAT